MVIIFLFRIIYRETFHHDIVTTIFEKKIESKTLWDLFKYHKYVINNSHTNNDHDNLRMV